MVRAEGKTGCLVALLGDFILDSFMGSLLGKYEFTMKGWEVFEPVGGKQGEVEIQFDAWL